MSKVTFVGLPLDLETVRSHRLPDRGEYRFCTDVKEATLVEDADEVVFVVSHYNLVSSHLILLLEAVEERNPRGTRWLLNLDGSEIAAVHRQLHGLPAGPGWFKGSVT